MWKFSYFSLIFLLMFGAVATAQDSFSKHKKIVGYEVRSGILAIPRYTASNDICEIGLERLQNTSKLIRLNAELSRDEILQVFDDIVPLTQRGRLEKDSDTFIERFGQNSQMTVTTEYENIILTIFEIEFLDEKMKGGAMKPVAATVKWKSRTCS